MPDDIYARYATAGFGGRARPGRCPAVLVVDFCLGFTDPGYAIGTRLDAEIEATTSVLTAARDAGRPVAFSTIAFPPGVSHAWLDKAPGLAVLREDSPATRLDPRLPAQPGDLRVTKAAASSFFGTDLAGSLRELGVDTVLICGATTSGCVRASAVDAVQHGFATLVVADCVGDRAAGPHEASLFDIQAKYGDVIPLARALDVLRGAGIAEGREEAQ